MYVVPRSGTSFMFQSERNQPALRITINGTTIIQMTWLRLLGKMSVFSSRLRIQIIGDAFGRIPAHDTNLVRIFLPPSPSQLGSYRHGSAGRAIA
jgi:hypothetical protein